MYTIERSRGRQVCLALVLVACASVPAPGQERATGIRLSGEEPIQIESDRLEVRENDNQAIFTGNVSVVQGTTLLKSGRMTVHYTQDGGSATTGSADIERLEVDGKVYVKSDGQEATGDRGTFEMATEVLVLTGEKVVLTEGPNVVVGCKLTVQMRTGQAQLDGCGGNGSQGGGRIRMLLQPQSQQR
jgi:lipopolysaccharide export system protein LptA